MKQSLQPDILVELHLFTPEEGGRQNGIPPVVHGCPIFIDGKGFDCRLLLDSINLTLELGKDYAEIPVKFLFLEDVKEILSLGVPFTLWEGKNIGVGRVTEVLF